MSDFIVEKLSKSVGDKTVFKDISFIIHDLDALRFMNSQAARLKHRIRMRIQESGLLGVADGIIAHNPIMKSVLVDKGVDADKIISLGIFDYLIPNFQDKTGLTKNKPIGSGKSWLSLLHS